MIAGAGERMITVTDSIWMIAGAGERTGIHETGVVDGPCARFNAPMTLTLEEIGRLLVFEGEPQHRLRIVEASLAPPKHLAAKVFPVILHPLNKLYHSTVVLPPASSQNSY